MYYYARPQQTIICYIILNRATLWSSRHTLFPAPTGPLRPTSLGSQSSEGAAGSAMRRYVQVGICRRQAVKNSISTCLYVCLYVRMYVCMYVCICMCKYVYTYICVYTYTYMYICIYVYIFMYVYIRMYMCITSTRPFCCRKGSHVSYMHQWVFSVTIVKSMVPTL